MVREFLPGHSVGSRFDLPTIEALSVPSGYGGTKILSDESVVLLLCAASYLSDTRLWTGANYELTDAEIDTIKSMVARATDELLADGDSVVATYDLLGQAVYTSDTGECVISDIDVTGYSSLRVVCSGLLTSGALGDFENVWLQFNEDTVAANYNSFGRSWYGSTSAVINRIGDLGAIGMKFVARSDAPSVGVFGNFDMTIYNPVGNDNKHISFTGMSGGGVVDEASLCFGQGVYLGGGDIVDLRLTPQTSFLFLIDPLDSSKPSELRMSVYGVK